MPSVMSNTRDKQRELVSGELTYHALQTFCDQRRVMGRGSVKINLNFDHITWFEP